MSRVAQRLGIDPRTLLGLSVLLAGTILWVLAFTGGIASLFSGSGPTIHADFASIEDIVPNDPVRIDGVQVGTVGGSTPDPGGRGATLTINLDSGAPPIYRDASASIVWRTALGANDAVALNPGTRAAGRLGNATISQSQDANQVELDQITQSAFHGGAPSGIRTMLQQLAPALDVNHQTLNDDFNTLAQIAPPATVGIGAVRGQIPDTDLKNLVVEAGRAAQALDVGTNGDQTRQFVQSAANTLSAISVNQQDLSADIHGLGIEVPNITKAFYDANAVALAANPLIAKLLPQASRVAPTLVALHPAIANLDTLLHNATPLLQQLDPAVHSLVTTAQAGVPVINGLSPSLKQLNDQILPGLNQRGPEDGGRTVYEEIGPVFASLGNLSNFFDSNGYDANFTLGGPPVEAQSAQVLPCAIDFTGKDLLMCESLSTALGTFANLPVSAIQNALRRPGGSGLESYLLASERSHAAFDAIKQKVFKLFPSLGRFLYDPNHGQHGS